MRENNIPKPREHKLPDGQMLRLARQNMEVIYEENVPIFASGLGSPAFLLEEAHAHGVKVWGLVGLPRQAARQIESGVDVVIAQGYDSGGHSGTVGTFTLVPEVCRMAQGTDTLILAAGGVNNGRQLAAAIMMGCAGVWTGTIWLATHESETEMFLKQRLVQARAEDPIQSRAASGKPARMLPSKYQEAWKQAGAPDPLPMPLQGMLVNDMQAGIKDARMEDWMTTAAGQSVVGPFANLSVLLLVQVSASPPVPHRPTYSSPRLISALAVSVFSCHCLHHNLLVTEEMCRHVTYQLRNNSCDIGSSVLLYQYGQP
jgi:NAD(P)H-dependent flavin oxidoreductase YrpB (nitropropane dioxygenase family)